jgi:hypothetical protein
MFAIPGVDKGLVCLDEAAVIRVCFAVRTLPRDSRSIWAAIQAFEKQLKQLVIGENGNKSPKHRRMLTDCAWMLALRTGVMKPAEKHCSHHDQ